MNLDDKWVIVHNDATNSLITRAIVVPGGVLVQVEQLYSGALSGTTTFVPGVELEPLDATTRSVQSEYEREYAPTAKLVQQNRDVR